MSNLFEHCRARVSSASAKVRISREKKASLLAFFPRRSIFDEVNDTNKPIATQIYAIAEAEYPRVAGDQLFQMDMSEYSEESSLLGTPPANPLPIRAAAVAGAVRFFLSA